MPPVPPPPAAVDPPVAVPPVALAIPPVAVPPVAVAVPPVVGALPPLGAPPDALPPVVAVVVREKPWRRWVCLPAPAVLPPALLGWSLGPPRGLATRSGVHEGRAPAKHGGGYHCPAPETGSRRPARQRRSHPMPRAGNRGGQEGLCHRHQPRAARGALAATFLPRRCTLPEFRSIVSYSNAHPRTPSAPRLGWAGSLAPAGHSVPVGWRRVRLERRRSGLGDRRRLIRQAHAPQDAPRDLGLGHQLLESQPSSARAL
jgi:hypothetical protein